MINTGLSNLTNETLFKIFYELPLKDIQTVASVCKKFSYIVSSEHFWKRYLPSLSLENVNRNFLEKHGSKLFPKQVALLNIKGPEELQKLMDQFKSDQKKTAFIMLTYSIRCLEREVSQYKEWEKYGAQRTHAHLLLCWGEKEYAFGVYAVRNSILYGRREQKKEWEEDKNSFIKSGKEILLEEANYENNCLLLNGCNVYLQIEAPQELTEFYTELWHHYSPIGLDPLPSIFERAGEMFTLMPVDVFSGFCNYISVKKFFGSFSWWYLTNEHLKLFNSAFKNCKFNEINVALLPDIEKKTLENFIQLVENKDLFSKVWVDFLDPEIAEAKELFENFDMSVCTNIKRWDTF